LRDVDIATVERTRCALCEHGLVVAVHGWPPHRKVPRTKYDGWAEAHLVAATCSRRRKVRHLGRSSCWEITSWGLGWWTV